MLMSSYKSVTTPEMLVRLWCHESKRVFEDRLINAEDHAWFKELLRGIVTNNFQMEWHDVVPQVRPTSSTSCGFSCGAENKHDEATCLVSAKKQLSDTESLVADRGIPRRKFSTIPAPPAWRCRNA